MRHTIATPEAEVQTPATAVDRSRARQFHKNNMRHNRSANGSTRQGTYAKWYMHININIRATQSRTTLCSAATTGQTHKAHRPVEVDGGGGLVFAATAAQL